MEKINIAELLKDCPKDMELDCTMLDDVTFEGIKQGKGISWKPSKEEMDVLYSLAYITNKYDEHKEEVITRLYQNLKRVFFNGSSYENMFPNTEDEVRRRSTIQVLEYARSLDNYNQYGKADIDKNIAWLKKIYKYEGVYSTDEDLQPYKEETMEEPKELIIGFTKDDNGDWVLNTHKDYEIKEIEGKYKVIKKQPQYPKDYEECYKIMKIHSSYECAYNQNLLNKINNFYKLLLCRDAYWKIAGEQMGLGKPWEPDCTDDTLKYGIRTYRNKINCNYTFERNGLLLFPTEEMQNEFYKNFRELIEQCKELL